MSVSVNEVLKQVFVFLSPPGGGKDTQMKLLEERGYIGIGTGHIFRTANDLGELSPEESALLTAGKYLPDEAIRRVVSKFFIERFNTTNRWCLNGIPRNRFQSELLLQIIKEHSSPTTAWYLAHFIVPHRVCIERVRNRHDPNRLDDDKIEGRLHDYEENLPGILQPIIAAGTVQYLPINGNVPAEHVWAQYAHFV